MKAISVFVRGFLLWCACHSVRIGQLLLIMLLAVSTSACAAAVHLPASHCDVSLEEKGHPSCLASSEPLRSSFEAVNKTYNRRDALYVGQTTAGGSSGGDDGPEGYTVNGRPGNQPWHLHMGNAAHGLIGKHYKLIHQPNDVFINTVNILAIVRKAGGNEALVRADEALKRPDITDLFDHVVFEIKSSADGELEKGKVKVAGDISAINRAMAPDEQFTHGTAFKGELWVRFGLNKEPWRIQWSTTAPGVVQYKWSKPQATESTTASINKAIAEGRWVDLTEADMQQHAEEAEAFANNWGTRVDTILVVQTIEEFLVKLIGDSAMILISSGLGPGKKVQPGASTNTRPPVGIPLVQPGIRTPAGKPVFVPPTAPGTRVPVGRPPQQPSPPPH